MAQLAPESFDKLIGKRIQKKRLEWGLSADKLSEYIGISQQQLSRYERGTNKINVSHLISIAAYLETPIEWFFEDCLSTKATDKELDKYWNELNLIQKQTLVSFLQAVKNS
ncbi:helix-turn-helix domain-containing protein [Caviibacterium pharyngocola]|uniref:XRE family transcriptional regulator n=1 Tax=Caviibacterium pharyngocola TaxID=28159 RepID=A0A2M8RVC9_9PAST|nr:helix-turn-helix transcriptional regulator [Caviibacterium pharyngocola]PJG82846.1 XRE family transcriptional regulator [Caviibacterium pharyngocola]